MSSLAIAILLLATSVTAPETDPLFATATACAVEPDPALPAFDATAAPVPAPVPEPRPLLLAAESRIRQEGTGPAATLFAVRKDGLTAPTSRPRGRLQSPGRAWPFALAATADAATTYWALARGGAERNPLLAVGRADVGMVKIIQFPLLAKAIDYLEARHPRLGRPLRWTTLVFHAVLAAHNVKIGRGAAQRGRTTSASGTP
jgi:hypothetical protein